MLLSGACGPYVCVSGINDGIETLDLTCSLKLCLVTWELLAAIFKIIKCAYFNFTCACIIRSKKIIDYLLSKVIIYTIYVLNKKG